MLRSRLLTISMFIMLALATSLVGAGCGDDDADNATATDEALEAVQVRENFVIANGAVEGGPRTIDVTEGEEVVIAITEADGDYAIHVHGIEAVGEVTEESGGELALVADVTGVYEVELHQGGDHIALGNLQVNPA